MSLLTPSAISPINCAAVSLKCPSTDLHSGGSSSTFIRSLSSSFFSSYFCTPVCLGVHLHLLYPCPRRFFLDLAYLAGSRVSHKTATSLTKFVPFPLLLLLSNLLSIVICPKTVHFLHNLCTGR